MTHLSKAGQPDYKLADHFINWPPVYKPVRFTIGSQHTSPTNDDQEEDIVAKEPGTYPTPELGVGVAVKLWQLHLQIYNLHTLSKQEWPVP